MERLVSNDEKQNMYRQRFLHVVVLLLSILIR